MISLRNAAAATTLLVWLGVSAHAQDAFPGGWAPEVGYQTFAAHTVQAAAAGFGTNYQGFGGYGMTPFGGFSAASGFTYSAGYGRVGAAGFSSEAAVSGSVPRGGASVRGEGKSVNAVTPLARAVRHATKKRNRRR